MRFHPALGAAALLALVAGTPALAAVSKDVGKALNAAASAAKSGNSGAAIGAIENAKRAASSAEEKSKVAQMAAYVYTRAGKFAQAAAELQSVGASPRQLAPLYYQAGQYDRAVAEARKGGGEDMQILIAQAAVRQGHYGEAVTAYNNLIKSNGPKPIYLENLSGAQFKSGDKKGYLATTERLIRVDSSPARWNALLSNFRQNPLRPEAKLAVFQLMEATGTLERAQDYQDYAKLLLTNNQAGTAADALAKAGPSGTDAMSQRLAQAAATMAQRAATEAPKLAASPATALRGGSAYLGLKQYPQAVAAFDKAIAAGGAQVDQAKMFKGIAQVKAGQGAAAKATFASISDAGGLKDTANLWSLYASTH